MRLLKTQNEKSALLASGTLKLEREKNPMRFKDGVRNHHDTLEDYLPQGKSQENYL